MAEIKVGIIVTARVRSSRIETKVLQVVNDRLAIEVLIENLLLNKRYPVVLAIPKNANDNILQNIAQKYKIDCYRGEDDSPLHRLAGASKRYGFDYVVRVTADDIIIDPQVLLQQVQFTVHGGNDYTWCSRIIEGAGVEVIRSECLYKVAERMTGPVEFISYYLKTPEFRGKEFYPPHEYQYSFRCTMDYPEDLLLLRVIYKSLPQPVGCLDIINFLRKNKYLLAINHQPKVTVYTVNHNYSQYIGDAIRSVMAQTFQDFEYIIYDDASTDGSVETALRCLGSMPVPFQAKARVEVAPMNAGLPAGCNVVLDKARGKYIIRLDSDDMLLPEALEMMVDEIERSAAGVVFSDYVELEDGKETPTQNTELHPACCLIRKRNAHEAKYKEGLKYYDGLEFFKRFLELNSMTRLDTVLWKYRRHPGQKTEKKNAAEREKVKQEVLKA